MAWSSQRKQSSRFVRGPSDEILERTATIGERESHEDPAAPKMLEIMAAEKHEEQDLASDMLALVNGTWQDDPDMKKRILQRGQDFTESHKFSRARGLLGLQHQDRRRGHGVLQIRPIRCSTPAA